MSAAAIDQQWHSVVACHIIMAYCHLSTLAQVPRQSELLTGTNVRNLSAECGCILVRVLVWQNQPDDIGYLEIK